MLLALTVGQTIWFLFEVLLIFAGIFVIAVLTPKLAAYIDKLRAKNKSPYESAIPPERVEDGNSKSDGGDDNSETASHDSGESPDPSRD